jgi:hypothetical protein
MCVLNAAAASCASAPLLLPDLSGPPAILVPTASAGVQDARARYREIFCAAMAKSEGSAAGSRCDDFLHRLGGEGPGTGKPVDLGPARGRLRLAIVPGYGADCFAGFLTVLSDARRHIASLGWRSEELHIEGLSSSARNAALIREQLLSASTEPGERFVLLGYSKGAPDMLEALARYPEIRPRVAAAVSLAGTVAGSPLADDPPLGLPRLVRTLSGSRCTEGDGAAFGSLRRSDRLAFLAEHPPSQFGVRLFSLGAFTVPERTSSILRPLHERLAAVDPRNDSQTVFTDQVIPGSVLLGYLNADHWAVALPLDLEQPELSAIFTEHNSFPRGPMLEAILRLVEERIAE